MILINLNNFYNIVLICQLLLELILPIVIILVTLSEHLTEIPTIVNSDFNHSKVKVIQLN